jgi:hypothetical protein
MSYLSSSTLAAIQSDPNQIVNVYGNTRTQFLKDLGPNFAWLSDNHIKLLFCGVVAFDMKPYGNGTATDFAGILASPTLQCQQYALLTCYLFQVLCPNPPATGFQIVNVGWNGGAVGNHAQISVEGGSNIFVDPTYGLFAAGVGYDWITSGRPVPSTYIADFRQYKSNSPVASSAAAVYSALVNGSYKPSDAMYYYRRLASMQTQNILSSPQNDIVRPAAA